MRLGGTGAVTGWASLRLHGAAYCDGQVPGGGLIPVPLISPRQLARTDDSLPTRARLDADEIVVRHGVRCTTVERALADELILIGDPRERVVVTDMVLAARLTSVVALERYLGDLRGRRKRALAGALVLADEHSESPRETRTRLVWQLDAGLPRPRCNPHVYGLDGRFLGKPDLLDVEAGVVVEYDGAAHRSRARHRRDVGRLERFRAAGLEDVTIVAGDPVDVQVDRMRSARDRALARTGPRGWTLEPPWANE